MKRRKAFSLMAVPLIMAALSSCDSKAVQSLPSSSEVKLADKSWETDKTPRTVTWFATFDWYSKTWNPSGNTSDARILNDTGISIEMSTGNVDKLNALISADALPDLVTMEGTASQRKLLENNQRVLPLEPLFATYAPDVNIPQSMKDWYRNDNGNWYAVASYYYGPERVNEEFGGYLVTHNNNFVRRDLLQQVGMTVDDLHTKEGFLNALRAAKKLKYNGMQVIPFTGWWTQNFAEQFGMDLEDKDGNLLQMIQQPEWLEALKFANTMYREGLISDEEFTQNQSQRDQKVASGQVFSASGNSTVANPKESLYSFDPNAVIIYAGQIKSEKTPLLQGVSSGGWTTTMISSNAKDPGRIAQFISYMTQEESTLNAAPAVGADTYDLINGKMVRKAGVIEEFQSDYEKASKKYLMNLEFFVDWTIVQKYTGSEPQTIWEEETIKMEQDPDIHVYDSKTFLAVSTEGGTDLAAIEANIKSYYDTAEKQIIMASSAQESERIYNEAIAEMKGMGWDQLAEYQNTQFKKAKERLGIQFAWPRNTGEVK